MPSNSERIFAEIGARLRVTRVAYELSQEDIATALGVDKGYVSRFEAGIRQPTYQQLIKFIDAMFVTADWLLHGYLDHLPPPMQKVLREAVPDLCHIRPARFPSAGPSATKPAAPEPATKPRSDRPRRRRPEEPES